MIISGNQNKTTKSPNKGSLLFFKGEEIMRKYLRQMMRAHGEKEYHESVIDGRKKKFGEKKKHLKPTSVVKYLFNQYQINKYGMNKRCANMAHGTHNKNTWPQRQAIADGLVSEQMKLAKMRG